MTRVGPIFKKKLIFKIQSKSRILGLKVSNFASIMKLSHAIFIFWIKINVEYLTDSLIFLAADRRAPDPGQVPL